MSAAETLRAVIRIGHLETNPVQRRLARTASVQDLRRIARRRLPGGVFDYIDGGAEDERTLRRQRGGLCQGRRSGPGSLRDMSKASTRRPRLLGQPLSYAAGPRADRLHPDRRPGG